MTFESLGVAADLVANLSSRGITEPFPIQAATIADSLAGKDICGKAPTGSGKTLAFAIPIIENLHNDGGNRPAALVLVPTRELAAQVQVVIEPLAKVRKLHVAALYGGVGFESQLRALEHGVDIIVACPGRLLDLMNRGAVSLGGVELAVVDEADRMADMGFLPDVRRILDQTRPDRQTLLFSATLDGDVDVLIRRYQNRPIRHEVVAPEDEEDNTLHLFWKAARTERVGITKQILGRTGATVIFTRTKHGADRLSEQLGRAGLKASAIHGGRSQAQRDRALAAFSSGRVQVLVATDVAARGIHVDGVDAVIHYDVPEDHKTYVHRSGRTARAGASGVVISLVQPDQIAAVTQMQRRLQMAAGVIDPDFRALPEDRPRAEIPVAKQQSVPDRHDNDSGPHAPRRRRRRRGPSRSPGSPQATGSDRPPNPRSRRRRRPAA